MMIASHKFGCGYHPVVEKQAWNSSDDAADNAADDADDYAAD